MGFCGGGGWVGLGGERDWVGNGDGGEGGVKKGRDPGIGGKGFRFSGVW